jgi:hypothetical protein
MTDRAVRAGAQNGPSSCGARVTCVSNRADGRFGHMAPGYTKGVFARLVQNTVCSPSITLRGNLERGTERAIGSAPYGPNAKQGS